MITALFKGIHYDFINYYPRDFLKFKIKYIDYFLRYLYSDCIEFCNSRESQIQVVLRRQLT
jgi:hypothetical protein